METKNINFDTSFSNRGRYWSGRFNGSSSPSIRWNLHLWIHSHSS